MRRLILILAGLLVAASMSSCFKVSVEDTGDESSLTAEYKADRMRTDWKDRIQKAAPVEKAGLLADYIENITGLYFQVGYETIENWRALQQQTERAVSSEDIQKMVDRWHADNSAFINAHDYNVEFAERQIRFTGYFAEPFLAQLDTLVQTYGRVKAAVLLPSGSLNDYEFAFKQLEYEAGEVLREYREELISL